MTVGAYFTSAVLGLVFAGLLNLRRSERTLTYSLVMVALLGTASLGFFTRPTVEYALVGTLEGRVAILPDTPQRIGNRIRRGEFEGAEGDRLQIRSAATPQRALELIETSPAVSAAFIPVAEVPNGLEVIWRRSFLPDRFWLPGVLLLAVGTIVAMLILGSLQSGLHPVAVFAEFYIDVIRGVPMLVVILFVGFVLASALKQSLGIDLNQYTRGVAALSIGYSAYMAEIFRAGIEAIPRGQTEVARSLGLSGWQTARYIVLPQAIKIVIPPLGNEFIAMLKDTALLSLISVRETTQRMREFQSNTFITFPTFNTAAVIYVILTLVGASLVKSIERRTDTA
ncbi:MAG: amino acid ABC transporter permease [Truepera sp.]|nr:amino acid ABC transporter permease [Truepera sp.]